MPPEAEPIEAESPEQIEATEVAKAVAAVDHQLSSTPADIKASPEFKAMAKIARDNARAAGTAKAREIVARTAAEQAVQAAEAQRQAQMEAQFTDILGEDGIAAYQEFAELSETDPVGAARRFASLMAAGQTPAAGAAAEAPPTAPEGNVPAPTPPMPSGAIDGNAPLSPPPAEDLAALTASLDARYADIVARNQDPLTRNRVTMRERAAGFIAYVGSAYVQATGRRNL